MHKQRFLIVVAAVIGIASMFLPWIYSSVFEIFDMIENGFHGVGIIVFFCFLAVAVMPFIGNRMQALDKTFWLLTLIAGTLAFLFTLAYIIKEMGNLGYSSDGIEKITYGFGVWISLMASVGIVLSAWLLKSPEHNLKINFESITNKFNIPTTTVTKTEATPNLSSTVSKTVATEQTKTNVSSNHEILNELERLAKMKNDGILTEEEFQEFKSKLLNS